MARNKKYRTGQTAIRFGPAVKALVLCLLIGGSGIGYVAEKHEIYQLGQQITKREAALTKLEDQNEKLRKQLGFMRSPQYLEKKIKEFNLGLVVPQQSQVWRLAEPAVKLQAPSTKLQVVNSEW